MTATEAELRFVRRRSRVIAASAPLILLFLVVAVMGFVVRPSFALFGGLITTWCAAAGPFARSIATPPVVVSEGLATLVSWILWLALIWRTRVGDAHWIVYTAVTCLWMGVGLAILFDVALGV